MSKATKPVHGRAKACSIRAGTPCTALTPFNHVFRERLLGSHQETGAALECRRIKTMRPCGDRPLGAGDKYVNDDSDIAYDKDPSKEAEDRTLLSLGTVIWAES